MYSDDFPSWIDDIPWFFWESFLEKLLHRNLANEAESLAIFAGRIWESSFVGDLSDL